MPKKLPTANGKRKAGAAASATQAPAKKTCPHRTPQTPFERLDEETTYIVDKMVGMRWNKGSRQYLVEAKAAVLAKRQEAKNAAAAVEVDLKACAAEAALAGA
jgi:hypothetical protein